MTRTKNFSWSNFPLAIPTKPNDTPYMNSIRKRLFSIFNQLMYLNPDKAVACTKPEQQAAFKEIRELLLELHASVDAAEEIIALLGLKKENSK